MAQKLIMPFKSQMMYCGYKNDLYKNYWGYPHYGIDLSSRKGQNDDHVRASGDGVVIAAGKDDSLGWGVVVLYKDCESRTGEIKDLGVKYMHLAACKVVKHDIVKAGDILGVEGREGTEDYHLHLEIDTDTRTEYARWTPQVSAGHTFWKKGVDTTLNPSLWLWVGEGQEIVEPIYNTDWLNAEDMDIPRLEEKEMSELVKLPINENVPLETADGEWEAHGEPVWAWVKKNQWLYVFDKYWRKIPTKTSNYGGEFASEEAWENAHPVTDAEIKTITEQVTDYNEYDENGNEELPEDITPDVPEAVKPIAPTNSDDIAKGIASMIKGLEYFAMSLGVYDKLEEYK